MERHDHAGGNGQTLNLRVIGGDYHYTAAGQLAQHEDTSTVQLSGDLFSGRWGTDGEWRGFIFYLNNGIIKADFL